MTTQKLNIYIREPISIEDGIPVFSSDDRYVENYKKIAHDHVAAISQAGHNPFIEEKLWIELENSTKLLVSKYIPDGARVLDAGVGLGRVLGKETRLERYGIDISYDYLQEAKKKGFNVTFSRIEDMPFQDNYFDAVIACDVLEHVIDLHSCCLQLMRVLKPGGILIIRVPNLDDMSAYLDESLPYEFIHLRSFDLPSLRILFGKVYGMQFKEHSYVAQYLKDSLLKVKFLSASSRMSGLAKKVTQYGYFTRVLCFWFNEGSIVIKLLKKFGYSNPPLHFLRRVSEISHEDFRTWIYGLRDNHPKLLEEILPEFVENLEVNVVFEKRQ